METTIHESKKSRKLREKLMLGNKDRETRKLYLLAFFLPMAVLELCYITLRVFPFGNNSLLALDLNAQYIYYYEGFRDAVLGDGGLLYSWSRTLGGESMGLNAYYMGSPFMLTYLLFPKRYITEALLTNALLRTGCASLAMAWYLKKTRGGETIRITIISLIYSMMAYMVMQQMDPMWLDAIIGLPLVMMGVERIVTEKRFGLYTGTLALVFISNFYIGYMVAIFTFFYFFYAYFVLNGVRQKKWFWDFVKKGLIFAFFSLLAAGIAATMIIPTYYSLSLGKLDFSHPSYEVKSKFQLVELIPKLLFGAYDTVRPEGLPTLFTSTMTLILVPIFYANKNVHVRKKIGMSALLLLLFMSMNISTADLVWHGMQNPNWLNYRYSFIPCALMLIMSYDALSNVKGGYTVGSVARACGIVLVMILFTEHMELEYIDTRITVWASLLIVLIYFSFLAFDAYHQGGHTRVVMPVLLGLVCVEMYASGITTLFSVHMDIVISTRDSYRDFVDETLPAAEWVQAQDTGFYRSEKTYKRCVNDPFAFRMKGISHSSSTLNKDGINYIEKLGYSVGAHWTEYTSPVVPVDAILGIKYVLEKSEKNNGLTFLNQVGNIYIYRNEHAMPLCFPVSTNYNGYDAELETDNPFDRVNSMLSAMAGSEEVVPFFAPIDDVLVRVEYENIDTRAYGEGYTKYSAETSNENCHIAFYVQGVEGKTLYAAFPTDYSRKVNLWLNDEFMRAYLSSNEDDGIIPLGQYSPDEEAKLLLGIPLKNQGGSEEVFLKDKLFYAFDDALFETYFAPLRDSVQNFTQVSNARFTMDITADADQILYMSIPYEQGWHMTVDGVETDVCRTEDGLIGITLTPGTHSYELWFLPDYFVYSLIISISSLVVFVVILLLRRMMRKRGWKPFRPVNKLVAEATGAEITDGAQEEAAYTAAAETDAAPETPAQPEGSAEPAPEEPAKPETDPEQL